VTLHVDDLFSIIASGLTPVLEACVTLAFIITQRRAISRLIDRISAFETGCLRLDTKRPGHEAEAYLLSTKGDASHAKLPGERGSTTGVYDVDPP